MFSTVEDDQFARRKKVLEPFSPRVSVLIARYARWGMQGWGITANGSPYALFCGVEMRFIFHIAEITIQVAWYDVLSRHFMWILYMIVYFLLGVTGDYRADICNCDTYIFIPCIRTQCPRVDLRCFIIDIIVPWRSRDVFFKHQRYSSFPLLGMSAKQRGNYDETPLAGYFIN